MATTVLEFLVSAQDKASDVLDGIGKKFEGLNGFMGRTASVMGGVLGAQAVNALQSGLSAAGSAVIDFNSTLENSSIAFTTMLGSGEKANAFLGQLQDFAKKTPFEFQGLVQNTQTLMGMGVAADQVIPTLTALGDSVASVGGGADVLDRTILAFGQTMAKGTLDMGNMNQLLQGGIPSALKVLASQYGVTTGEMVKMISAGKVQASEALPKLISGLEQGTKSTAALGGMMDKQSATFSGAMSNIQDALTQGLASGFKPLFQAVSDGAGAFASFLSTDKFQGWVTSVTGGVKRVLDGTKGLFDLFVKGDFTSALRNAFGVEEDSKFVDILFRIRDAFITIGNFVTGTVVPALQSFGQWAQKNATWLGALAVGVGAMVTAWKIYQTTMTAVGLVVKAVTAIQAAFSAVIAASPVGLITLAVVGLVAAFMFLWNRSEGFRNFWIGLWDALKSAAEAVGHWFSTTLPAFFSGCWDRIKSGAETVWNFLKMVFGWTPLGLIVNNWDTIIGFFRGLPDRIGSAASGMWNGIIGAFKNAINTVIRLWNDFHLTLGGGSILGVNIPSITLDTPNLPYLASGGYIQQGGLAIVGERGPEVVSLPTGATVHPNGSGAGGPLDLSDRTIERLAVITAHTVNALPRRLATMGV